MAVVPGEWTAPVVSVAVGRGPGPAAMALLRVDAARVEFLADEAQFVRGGWGRGRQLRRDLDVPADRGTHCADRGARMQRVQAHLAEFWVAWSYNLSRRFEGTPVLMRLVELAAAGLSLFAAWRHRAQIELVIAAALLGSLLATPFLHLDDLMLLFPAGWLVLRAAPSLWNALGLLVIYGFMMRCNHEGAFIAGRWVLLGECIWLVALAAWPRRVMPAAAPAPQPAVP